MTRLANSVRVLGVLASLCPAACVSVQHATLNGPAPVQNASLRLAVDRHREGAVSARLPNGETCSGRFNTVADELDTWDEEWQTSPQTEISQVGMLVLVCPAGLVLRCDFSRAWEGAGSGLCWDRERRRYGLAM